MIYWTSGAVYGLGWLCFWMPTSLLTMLWFWQRRDLQPIKARSPALVLISDILLIAYAAVLCLRPIVGDSYPCSFNIWSSYIGTIALCNVYLWRCWTLYFAFRMTQQRIESKDVDKFPFFLRHRSLVTGPFLSKFLGTVTVILLTPVAILVEDHDDIFSTLGDKACVWYWGRYLLPIYFFVYALIFSWFAWTLRSVQDNFQIQSELKWTGAAAMLTIIPWVVFNTAAKDFNDDVFPISTLCLLFTVFFLFVLSTAWPLYRSIWQPPEPLTLAPSLDTLVALLNNEAGLKSFQEFLTKEFSVENLQFFLAVEEYRKKKRELEAEGVQQMVIQEMTQKLYDKFIVENAPFQVNLPASSLRIIQKAMKNSLKIPLDEQETDEYFVQNDYPTVFDRAQYNILRLMETDSSPRYFRSELFQKLRSDLQQRNEQHRIMKALGII